MGNREKYKRELDAVQADERFKQETKNLLEQALRGDAAATEALNDTPTAPAEEHEDRKPPEKAPARPWWQLRRRGLAAAACLVVVALGLVTLTRPGRAANATAPADIAGAASVAAGAPPAAAQPEETGALPDAEEAQPLHYVRGEPFFAFNLQDYGGRAPWVSADGPPPAALPVYTFPAPTAGSGEPLTLAGRDLLTQRAADAAAALGTELAGNGEEVRYTSLGREVAALLFYFEGGGLLAGADGSLHVMLDAPQTPNAGPAPTAEATGEEQEAWALAVAEQYAPLLQMEGPLAAEVTVVRSANGTAWPIYGVFEQQDSLAERILCHSLRRADYQLDTAGRLVGFSLYLCETAGMTELAEYTLLAPEEAFAAEAQRRGREAAHGDAQRIELCYLVDTDAGLVLPCYRFYLPMEAQDAPEGTILYEVWHCPALDGETLAALGSGWAA